MAGVSGGDLRTGRNNTIPVERTVYGTMNALPSYALLLIHRSNSTLGLRIVDHYQREVLDLCATALWTSFVHGSYNSSLPLETVSVDLGKVLNARITSIYGFTSYLHGLHVYS